MSQKAEIIVAHPDLGRNSPAFVVTPAVVDVAQSFLGLTQLLITVCLSVYLCLKLILE